MTVVGLGEITAAFDTEGNVTQAGFDLAARLSLQVLPPNIGALLYGRLTRLWRQVDPSTLDPNYLVAQASLRGFVRELLALVPPEYMPVPVCTCGGVDHVLGCPLGSPFGTLRKTAEDTPWWQR